MNTSYTPDNLAAPNGFAHAVRSTHTSTVYIAGQVSYDEKGQVVGAGDLAAQTAQVYANIGKALASAGASFDDVVKTVLFVKDLDAKKAAVIRDARAQFFKEHRLPASTMVGVASLAKPELLLEVEAIAMYDGDRQDKP